jgi:hypothetical protein
MKYKFLLIASLFFITITANKCKKEPPLPEFYFRCKVDGQDYRPNGCPNCLTCAILGDTTFLLGANRGYEVVTVGVIDNSGFKNTDYLLNHIISSRGTYKNSTTVDDRYYTDSLRTGNLIISLIDKSNKIIEGTFSFQAYNLVQNKTVSVTGGKFRLQYTTN